MFGSIKQGLTDAAFVTLGQVGSNLIGRVIPTLPLPGMIGDGLKSVGAALVVGFVSSKALKGDQARMATAGAFAAALQSLIRKAGIPVLSTSFGDYEPGVGSYSSLGAYSAVQSLPGVGIGDIDAADADYADQMDQYEGY